MVEISALKPLDTIRFPSLGVKSDEKTAVVTAITAQNAYDLPVPFVNLWMKLSEYIYETTPQDLWIEGLWVTGPNCGIFWRLYSVYRFNVDFENIRKQIKALPLDNQFFWAKQLPVTIRQLKPYVYLNRYIVIPWLKLKYWWLTPDKEPAPEKLKKRTDTLNGVTPTP